VAYRTGGNTFSAGIVLAGTGAKEIGPSFANDLFEAVDDWCHLARRAWQSDTRVPDPRRAAEELALWHKLQDLVRDQPAEEQARSQPILETAKRLLSLVGEKKPLTNGHLDVLKILRQHFSFLNNGYGFHEVSQEPTGLVFASDAVSIQLETAMLSSLSFSFGRLSRPGEQFWIEDLLYLSQDERYKTVPQRLALESPADVETWFTSVADVLHRYGSEVLCNDPETFSRLGEAQRRRDDEYVQQMNSASEDR
jgi:hypothetical protein